MVISLSRYALYLSQITCKGDLSYVKGDLLRYSKGEEVFSNIGRTDPAIRNEALRKAVEWLWLAQKAMIDNGMGSYHLAKGWGTSYPETTGYIIPTLLNYYQLSNEEKYRDVAINAAEFLINIQKPSGGWQGGRVGENKPEIVFNTAQVIRGLMALYLVNSDERYILAAEKAANWLCQVQHPDGYWKEHALMNEARVYDAYVDAPLVALSNITGNDTYRETALKNLEWIISKNMNDNGWFSNCDNTVKHNDRPILHTIAYTIDGLMESDELLRDGRFLQAARIGADELKRQLLDQGRLFGRYDRNWTGSEYFLCTGAAQMAIVWMRFYGLEKNATCLQAADRALDILVYIEERNHKERKDTVGALPGSFPIWGRYEPFAFPNWATKFFADALMMRIQIDEGA
jgi:hypothetical protein